MIQALIDQGIHFFFLEINISGQQRKEIYSEKLKPNNETVFFYLVCMYVFTYVCMHIFTY